MRNSETIKLPFFGEIPKGWTSKNLADISIKIGDGLHGTPNYTDNTGYYFVNGNNLENGVITINEQTKCVDESEYKKHKKELSLHTILISINGTIGKIAKYNGEKIVLGKSAAYLICPEENLHFLFHVLQSEYVNAFFESELTGSTIRNLSLKSIRETPIPFPPLPEQQKIAAILSKWDELIATQTKLIEAKEKQKKSLMQKLLTGEVRFPGFEGEWVEYTLGEHLTFQNGYAFKSKLFNDKNKGLRLVKNRDLKNDNLVIFTTETFKPEYLIANGDLLVGMDGDFSPCIWKKGESLLNQRVGRLLNFSEKVKKEFLYYFLTDILTKIQNDTGSTTVKHLSGSDITELNVLIPNLKEQEKIANTLIACDEELQLLKDELEAIKLQKKGLMQQLLTGKIRVKI